MCELSKQFLAAIKAGVPLISIETPDQPAAYATLAKMLAKELTGDKARACIGWDIAHGFRVIDEEGADRVASLHVVQETNKGNIDATIGKPGYALTKLAEVPPGTVCFIFNSQRFICTGEGADPISIQATCNLRDKLKANPGRRHLVLLGPGHDLPPELSGDTLQLDEPLPDDERLGMIVDDVAKAIEGLDVDDELRGEATDALRGIPAFQAEQLVSINIKRDDSDQLYINTDGLWSSKRKQISATRGLGIVKPEQTFDQIGGCSAVKEYFTELFNGPHPPTAVVWLDEIEKTGLNATNDTSGVNQDQLGTLLTHLEDSKAFGCALAGPPGVAKSAMCKALAAEFNRLVIRLDLGEMLGSLVGESQQALRAALRVINAVAGENALWVVTSNTLHGLDDALKSRLPDIWFFSLPDGNTRKAIQNIWLAEYGLPKNSFAKVDTKGWAGRNIQRCCMRAWRTGKKVAECAKNVIPVAKASRNEIAELRHEATDTYLCAENGGIYGAVDGSEAEGRTIDV